LEWVDDFASQNLSAEAYCKAVGATAACIAWRLLVRPQGGQMMGGERERERESEMRWRFHVGPCSSTNISIAYAQRGSVSLFLGALKAFNELGLKHFACVEFSPQFRAYHVSI